MRPFRGQGVADPVGEALVDGDHRVGGAGQRAEQVDVGIRVGQKHPIAVVRLHNAAGVQAAFAPLGRRRPLYDENTSYEATG